MRLQLLASASNLLRCFPGRMFLIVIEPIYIRADTVCIPCFCIELPYSIFRNICYTLGCLLQLFHFLIRCLPIFFITDSPRVLFHLILDLPLKFIAVTIRLHEVYELICRLSDILRHFLILLLCGKFIKLIHYKYHNVRRIIRIVIKRIVPVRISPVHLHFICIEISLQKRFFVHQLLICHYFFDIFQAIL